MKVARQMEAALQAYATSPPWQDALVRIWRRATLALKRRTGAGPSFRLSTGGAIVAIMGGDGSGKTTALRGLVAWLGEYFDVKSVHLGKPPWSLLTYALRGGLKAASTAGSRSRPAPDDGEGDTVGRRRLVWYAVKARDRYLAYRKARRAAARGTIVLSDRFPHPALERTDVPQVERLVDTSNSGWFIRALAGFENHFHGLVGLPEVAIVLTVDPEEAGRRKVDERYEYVLERAREIERIEWSDSGVHVVDGGRPPDVVLADIKSIVWDSLT